MDNIDAETLQARIDMSLAQVHELVSSWIKPYPGSTEGARVQEMVERDIERYSKRPPHLGVGAVFQPSTAETSSRDVVRLKGRLVPKKSQRVDAHNEEKPKAESDDEESRASAFMKKGNVVGSQNLDRFETKKTKKTKLVNGAREQTTQGPDSNKPNYLDNNHSSYVNSEEPSISTSSSTQKRPPSPVNSSPSAVPPQENISNGDALEPDRTRHSKEVPKFTAAAKLFGNPSFSSHVEPPPSSDDDQAGKDDNTTTSPSAKRKRKRRKKHHRQVDRSHNTPDEQNGQRLSPPDTISLARSSSTATEPPSSTLSLSTRSSPTLAHTSITQENDSLERSPGRSSVLSMPHYRKSTSGNRISLNQRKRLIMKKIVAKERQALE